MADPIDTRAFEAMTTAVDKTAVSLFEPEVEKGTKGIHNALLAAGMTPAYGNIADVADATLYALEGEFGEAAWSMAAAIPIVGQMVAGRRAAKVAKEAGEEMVTLYRGVDKWHKGKMVKEGKFVGGFEIDPGFAKRSPKVAKRMTEKLGKELHTTPRIGLANYYSRLTPSKGSRAISKDPVVLEFEIPMSYIRKFSRDALGKLKGAMDTDLMYEIVFKEGLPKEFLKKVHK